MNVSPFLVSWPHSLSGTAHGHRLSETNVPILLRSIRSRRKLSQVSIRHLGPSQSYELLFFSRPDFISGVNGYGRARIYSLFRIVPGDVFLTDFATDRSHMVSRVRFLPTISHPSRYEQLRRDVPTAAAVWAFI